MEKKIVYKIDGVKETWVGKLTTLLKMYPKAQIISINELD